MKYLKISTITAGLLITSTSLFAGPTYITDTSELIPNAIGAEIGSMGYGANLTWYANDYVDLQVGYNGGDIIGIAGDTEVKVEGIDYTAETDFSTPYVGLQLRPMKNWFTVGTGVLYTGGSEISATATPATGKTFTYDGKSYEAQTDAKIDATLEFEHTLSPYLTFGFHPTLNNKFGIFGDIGIAYTGGFDSNVDATGSYTYEGSASNLSASEIDELEERARKEIEDELSGNDEFYPILKVGATYKF